MAGVPVQDVPGGYDPQDLRGERHDPVEQPLLGPIGGLDVLHGVSERNQQRCLRRGQLLQIPRQQTR